jgi:hypothetical protein
MIPLVAGHTAKVPVEVARRTEGNDLLDKAAAGPLAAAVVLAGIRALAEAIADGVVGDDEVHYPRATARTARGSRSDYRWPID